MGSPIIRPLGRRLMAALSATAIVLAAATAGAGSFGTPFVPSAAAQTTDAPPATSVTGDAPKPESGLGKLALQRAGSSATVKPGGKLVVKGTGYAQRPNDGFLAFKLNDGNLKLPAQSGDVDEVDAAGTAYFRGNHLPDEDGSFCGKIAIPTDLAPGWYWLRNLSGSDGGGSFSHFAWFKVDSAAPDEDPNWTCGATENPDEPPVGTPSASGDIVSVPVSVNGLTPGGTLTAFLGGVPATFGDGGAGSVTLDADGAYRGTVRLPAGALRAGERKFLALNVGGKNQINQVVTGVPSAEFTNWQARQPDTSAGAVVDVRVGNLPAGAKVTGLGTSGTNWIAGSDAVADDTGVAQAVNVRIGNVAAGTPISVTVENGGTAATYATGRAVTASNAPVNDDRFPMTCENVPSGTGGLAYDAGRNALYVSRTSAEGSSLLRVDATTLGTVATAPVDPAHPVGDIALDASTSLLWATNPAQGTVAAYSSTDLSLVRQFADGSSANARALAVDPQNHQVYVTKETSPYGEVDIYDGDDVVEGKADAGAKSSVRIDGFGATGPVSVDEGTGDVYVASTTSPRAVRISARDGSNALDKQYLNDRTNPWSAIAYDPDQYNLWLADESSSGVVVLDAPAKKVVNTVYAGTSTLDLRYEPKNRLVYATSAQSGTVTVFDGLTLQKKATVAVGTGAGHLVTDPAGNAYVLTSPASGSEPGTICRISPQASEEAPGHAEGSLGAISQDLFGTGSDTGSVEGLESGSLGDARPLAILGIGALGIGGLVAIQAWLDQSAGTLPPDVQRLVDTLFR